MTYRIMVMQKGFFGRELLLWKVKSYTLEYDEYSMKLTTIGNNDKKIIRIYNKNEIYGIAIRELGEAKNND